MRFGTAIERLVDNYEYAKSKIWIRDEVAWALYHTWKEADDRKTEPSNSEKPNNSTISKMEQVEDETRLTAKCLNCANGGSYKCSKCDGEMYYKYDKDEPHTNMAVGKRSDATADKYNLYGKTTTDEPQTEREGE